MSLTPFERAFVAHWVADWLLQNDWMAHHKTSLSHPAAWVHGAIQALALAWALGWVAGLALGLLHVLIDTRVPLRWWIDRFKKSAHAPDASNISLWTDQALHIAVIALWIELVPRG
jgi:Na+(H+)/acetate symporter ActP